MNKRIFSGVQPSGVLHIGNYLGAIKNWVALQKQNDCVFCVVDLHAITAPQDPKMLGQKTLEIAKIYLAAGIDPEKSTIFVQSHIKEHAELCWILNTIAKVSELERMTQFKEKSAKTREGAGMGLFDYPVLMAADILLYDTQTVPVGEDQIQHVELARTLARRFNSTFGDTFVIPEVMIKKEGARIMGLDDPAKKMSKSAASPYNYITLTDSPDLVREKVKKAVTDSGKEIIYNPQEKPALANLLTIYSLLSEIPVKEIEKKYNDLGYVEFKNGLAEVIIKFLEPFQEKYFSLKDDAVLKIFQQGAKKAQALAARKMEIVREKIGLI